MLSGVGAQSGAELSGKVQEGPAVLGGVELRPDVERTGLATAPTSGSRSLTDGTAGARLHPYADLQPAGTRSADLRRLGHRSPGSAG